MKKTINFFLLLVLLLVTPIVKAQTGEGGDAPIIIDDRFFGYATDLMLVNHLDQTIKVHTYKAGDLTYDCGVKGEVDLPPSTPAYFNLHAARFLTPITYEDKNGITNVSYEKEFQAPYLALQISFDGSYEPTKSRGVKWIFSISKKEMHICSNSKDAAKYDSKTSFGVVFVPAPENAPIIKLQNESSYLIQIVTPGLSFSNKTLDKNGATLGMNISDREKVNNGTGFYVIDVRVMKEAGQRSILTQLEIPVIEGATVSKITDDYFPDINQGVSDEESMVDISITNMTKWDITVSGIANEKKEEATINIPSRVTGEDIYVSEKGLSQITVQATVAGILIRSDILVQVSEGETYQIRLGKDKKSFIIR